MRFLIDECLHESLVGVAHSAGFEATHVNHLGLSGRPDWELAERIVEDEFTFVTNNRVDLSGSSAAWNSTPASSSSFRTPFPLSSVPCSKAPFCTLQERTSSIP